MINAKTRVLCQNAAQLPVIVNCSSTVYHNARIAESSDGGGDNESDTYSTNPKHVK